MPGPRRCPMPRAHELGSHVVGRRDLEREIEALREQICCFDETLRVLGVGGRELASTRDVNSMLETITRRAGVAVRAPRYLLVAQLPGDPTPRIHYMGFTHEEAEAAAHDVLHSDPAPEDRSRLVSISSPPEATSGGLRRSIQGITTSWLRSVRCLWLMLHTLPRHSRQQRS